MEMIQCPYCGREVGTKARVCTQCGSDITDQMPIWYVIILVVIVFVLLIFSPLFIPEW